MRHRTFAVISAVIVLVLVGAAVASAAETLTIGVRSRWPATITYPRITQLTVTTPQTQATSVTVQYRYADSSTWIRYRSITASRAAEATSFNLPFKPSKTAYLQAWQGGDWSNIATVTVKAKLSRPRLAKGWLFLRKNRTAAVYGFIWPRHARGTAPVKVEFYKRINGRRYEDTPTYSIDATIVAHGRSEGELGSLWKATFVPKTSDKGAWRVVATHTGCLAHADSVARPSFFWIR